MIKLLIYGSGEIYQILKRIIIWENVRLEAFVDSWKFGSKIGGVDVISPHSIALRDYDYILCASDYEYEMRKTLKMLGIPDEKIISGKLDYRNILDHKDVFDVSHFLAYQNQLIAKSANTLIERNRFCDIKQEIDWLEEKISITGDGAWAVGYDYLSALCKILQIMKPQNILEMGLGQSSKVILSYQKNSGCKYKIIEQDEEWLDFFISDYGSIANGTEIFIRPIKQMFYETYDAAINCYSDISDIVAAETYDVISIDGPWGSEGISRIDILPYIPQCLKKSWCILIDDYERDGEKNLVCELEKKLQNSVVHYCKKVYGKDRQLCLLTSDDNRFMCSLF
jgi:hypothetical protein